LTVEELIDLVKPENPYIFGYTPKKNPYITKGDTTYIGLTQNKYTTIDTEDLSKIENYRWCSTARKKRPGYAVTSTNAQKNKLLQSLIFPEYVLIDHININGLDNRKKNLRNANTSLNNLNINPRSSSGYLGVHKHLNSWEVKIQVKGKEYNFGTFKTPEEANIVAKRERARIIRELEEGLNQENPPQPTQSSPGCH
jgi:hypothetical protein